MNYKSKTNAVAFFDSGIGGLNYLARCVKKMPQLNYYYFADNFNVPYGSKSVSELIKTADRVFSEIEKLSPVCAVVACNTVTAICIDYLRNKYPFPVIGVQPAVKPAVRYGGRCLILCTPVTAESRALNDLVNLYGNDNTNIMPCPDLASYIESNAPILSMRDIFAMLPPVKADAVVLGCTHYTYAKEYISGYYGGKVFDGIDGTVKRICMVVGMKGIVNTCSVNGNVVFVGGDERRNRDIFSCISH